LKFVGEPTDRPTEKKKKKKKKKEEDEGKVEGR
jgi:hypothetical protein